MEPGTFKYWLQQPPHIQAQDPVVGILILFAVGLAFAIIASLSIAQACSWWEQYKWRKEYDSKYLDKLNQYRENKEIVKKDKKKKRKERTVLLAHERDTPPKATFFGRENGKYLHVDGDYEEEYLNSFEMRAWEEKKRNIAKLDKWQAQLNEIKKERALLAEKLAKLDKTDEKPKNFQQNQ